MRLCLTVFLLILPAAGFSQQVIAPTPERVGLPRGENVEGYNVVNSFETGFRFRSLAGNRERYFSDVNFGNGFRLLGSQLSIHSREGRGGLFDEILLGTQGLGNDPYQSSSLRIQKNRVYRYDMQWRRSEFYNPAFIIAEGQHLADTSRVMQDHDITLLPDSSFRLFLGYSRNSQSGSALSTVNLFDIRADAFPLFSDVRRLSNEFRLGGEFQVRGVKFNWSRGWTSFREDSEFPRNLSSAGDNEADPTSLASFRRAEPFHGSTPYWRLALMTERSRGVAVSARFNYSGGRRNFVFDENALGTSRFGAAQGRQILAAGDARRPIASGSFTINLFPSSQVTVINQTAFHHARMEGDSAYRQINNNLASELVFFQFLGVRTISNTTDLNYSAAKWLGLYGGYHFSTRRIRSKEQVEFFGTPEARLSEQDNRVHSGVAGVRLRPAPRLTLNLESEIARADQPFFPVGDRNYHALRARLQYRTRSLLLAAAARSDYNTNSVTLAVHSSRSRNYAFDASWNPSGGRFSIDAGYSRQHLDTVTGIAYFMASALKTGDRSLYTGDIHAVHAGARVSLWKFADVYVGYTRVQDVGDGRALPAGAGIGSDVPFFQHSQTYPLTFESPLARVSLRLHEKIRWNFGYQYYGYREKFLAGQNYRANTGYTSVLWSF